jgi:hypothetical protein
LPQPFEEVQHQFLNWMQLHKGASLYKLLGYSQVEAEATVSSKPRLPGT